MMILKTLFSLKVTVFLVLASATLLTLRANAQLNTAKELAGLWGAKRRFGPDVSWSRAHKTDYRRVAGGDWRLPPVAAVMRSEFECERRRWRIGFMLCMHS